MSGRACVGGPTFSLRPACRTTVPKHICAKPFVDPAEFRERVESASVVVAHAGMGSIITALELGKPIIVMPRRGDLGEHRNDHQLATARRFAEQGRIIVTFNERELLETLDQHVVLHEAQRLSMQASPQLIATSGICRGRANSVRE